ncbi:MAG: tetratricopeptide repeat protein [Candidatus Hydrogenedentota bacterium]|nr:MAG: tetratricopeptide repeat protein [Candidatus Hydrogenedentota bacterium]
MRTMIAEKTGVEYGNGKSNRAGESIGRWERASILRFLIVLLLLSFFFPRGVISAAAAAPASGAGSLSTIARSHYDLGLRYLAAGLSEKALNEFQQAADADPAFYEAQVQTAKLLIDRRRYADAAKYYKQAVEIRPNDAVLQAAYAGTLYRAGNKSAALVHYRKSLLLNPNQPKIGMLLARVELGKQRYRNAIDLLEKVPALKSDRTALTLRAFCYHKLGNLEKAADLYRQVLAKAPDDAEVRLNLGLIEKSRGRLEEAARQLERAAPRVKESRLAYRTLGLVQFDLGRYNQAISSFRNVLIENEKDVAVRYKLAQALLEVGRIGEAVREMEKVREYGDYPELSAPLGLGYYRLGKYDAALPELERAWRANPSDSEVLNSLADVYYRMGRLKEAIRSYELIAERAQDRAPYYKKLASLYAEVGRAARALEYERKYRDVSEQNEVQEAVEAERAIWRSRYEKLAKDAEQRLAKAQEENERRIQEINEAAAKKVEAMRREMEEKIRRIQAEADSRVAWIQETARKQVEQIREAAQTAVGADRIREEVRKELLEHFEREKRDWEAALRRERTLREQAEERARALERRSGPARMAPAPGAESAKATEAPETESAAVGGKVGGERGSRKAAEREPAVEAGTGGIPPGYEAVESASLANLRERIATLSAALEREKAIKEEALAAAERKRAEAEAKTREAKELEEQIDKEIMFGLKELGAETEEVANRTPLERLKYYIQKVRLTADARVAKNQLDAEERIRRIRLQADSEIAKVLADAKKQIDRARVQAEEEIAKAQAAADSEVIRRVNEEKQRLASEALAKRLALAEKLRAEIEANAQVKYLEEKAKIEATYEADRIRMQRDYDNQLSSLQAEYQKRLEAAQTQAKRLQEQMEALTKNDTALLARSDIYQRVVRENAMIRQDLASARKRLEELGREKEELIRESDQLRSEMANLQARLGALEQEARRYKSVTVLEEPLEKGINLNTASIEELRALPGVGIQEARNIVWYRENVGEFRSVDELAKVPGFDAKSAKILRSLVRVR